MGSTSSGTALHQNQSFITSTAPSSSSSTTSSQHLTSVTTELLSTISTTTSSAVESFTSSSTIPVEDFSSSTLSSERSSSPSDKESSSTPLAEKSSSSTTPMLSSSSPVLTISTEQMTTKVWSTSTCTDDEFRCPSGQCVALTDVCNEVYDCLDKGDEANCPDCAGFRCKSNNVCLWDRNRSRCNQVFDCEDYSDEIGCQKRPGQYLCSNGVQIQPSLVCDGLDDCGDNSDEETCACNDRQFPCSDRRGKCVPSTWVCDGHPDCENGTDEESCDFCKENDFRCNDYTCVNSSLRCDGKVDCGMAGGDEDGCVELSPSGEVRVMVGSEMLPVCSDGWQDEHSKWVCSSIHDRNLEAWTVEPASSRVDKFAVLQPSAFGNTTHRFDISDACHSDTTVHVTCQDKGCGQRKVDILESFVAGGSMASLGKWPWVVSLAYLGKSVCGGTLIAPRWVLTAAHCILFPVDDKVDYKNSPFYFTITAGAVVINANYSNTQAEIPRSQTIRVSKITLHLETAVLASGGVDWDIAVLQLEEDVAMSDLVQPICLPAQSQLFMPASVCYVAGWGLLSFRQTMRASHLRDSRTQLWSEARCSRNTVVGEKLVNTNSTLCAGYLFGRPTACQGDSGGPLMCEDPSSGVYTLAGVVSRGSDRCGRLQPHTHSNRFARVSMATDWIQEAMIKSQASQ